MVNAMARTNVVALLLLTVPALVLGRSRRLAATPSVTTSSMSKQKPTDLKFVSRVYVPYDNQGNMGFDKGAAESIEYDHVEKYAYAISEQGFVNVIDWNDPTNPTVLPNLALDLNGGALTDLALCVELGIMFVGAPAADTVSDGTVHIYTLVKRDSPTAPVALQNHPVGPLPDMILPNSACTMLAVGNEGEGVYGNTNGLVDPEGSVHILASDNFSDPSVSVNTYKVSLGGASPTDAQLKADGVHLPLEKNAMEFWDDHSSIAADVDFSAARATYTPQMNLEPEYLAWSGDETTLFVNLQENNAIASINVPASGTPTFSKFHSLGMKDHATVPVDILDDDKACNLSTYAGLKALRMPDTIRAIKIDGVDYVLTANEGDDKEYGDYEEKKRLRNVVDKDGNLGGYVAGMTAVQTVLDTAALVHGAGQDSMRVTLGSSAVDYSTANAPVIQHPVLVGGRGMSIWKYQTTGGGSLALEWDSGSTFEEQQCAHYPWAHNSEVEDDKTMAENMDSRSPNDGAGSEGIVVGTACGSVLAVATTERGLSIFVYDITTPSQASLLMVKHLSEASQSKTGAAAYADKSLGEVDPESMVLLDENESPSGKPGVMFAGALSGTLSWWEFECPGDMANTTTTSDGGMVLDGDTASSALRYATPLFFSPCLLSLLLLLLSQFAR